VNGCSVPLLRSTLYCSGVRRGAPLLLGLGDGRALLLRVVHLISSSQTLSHQPSLCYALSTLASGVYGSLCVDLSKQASGRTATRAARRARRSGEISEGAGSVMNRPFSWCRVTISHSPAETIDQLVTSIFQISPPRVMTYAVFPMISSDVG
jgi:hypothetical protein